MALPCVCYRCAKCINLESLQDPECLNTELINCSNRDCKTCNFICYRFIESDQLPATSDQLPATSDQLPATSDQLLADGYS